MRWCFDVIAASGDADRTRGLRWHLAGSRIQLDHRSMMVLHGDKGSCSQALIILAGVGSVPALLVSIWTSIVPTRGRLALLRNVHQRSKASGRFAMTKFLVLQQRRQTPIGADTLPTV